MAELNLEQARHNMIEQQIRTWEVLDPRVLDVLASTPRESFVPERYRKLAFTDVQIPLGHGQVMMEPKLEGRVLQSLEIRPEDSILEIGTGSGYLTACLARLGRKVHSVDIFPEFTDSARVHLASHGLDNVSLSTADAATGWMEGGPYDVIALTGSLPLFPEAYPRALAAGGRMFVIVGELPVMEALLVRHVDEQSELRTSLFETEIPALVNAPQPQRFSL